MDIVVVHSLAGICLESMAEQILDENAVNSQVLEEFSDSDDGLSISNLTQVPSTPTYEFLDSGDEDENAFPFSPIFGKKYGEVQDDVSKVENSHILYDNVVAEPITSDEERYFCLFYTHMF